MSQFILFSPRVVEGDIDLSGVNDAYKNIQSGWLGSPIAAVNP